MKKAEFIGYLYALKDLAVDDTFDDFDDGVEWVLDKIIERAKDLEEPMGNILNDGIERAKDLEEPMRNILNDGIYWWDK